MKTVILAAGQGRRLSPLTNNMPKCLVDIKGESLLDYSFKSLLHNGINEVILVTGYLGDKIKRRLGNIYNSIKITYVDNSEYLETDSLFSLLCAKDLIDDAVLVIESDLLYTPSAIKKILSAKEENIILTSKISGSGDEILVYTDESNYITNLGKDLNRDKSSGEFIGISKLTKDFVNELAKIRDNKKLWLEEGILKLAKKGTPISSLCVEDLIWTKIDTQEDLQRAREITYPKLEKAFKLNWKEIWERKGNEDTSDLVRLDGFDLTGANIGKIANELTDILNIKEKDKVLEVGCGAGMIAQYLKCNYIGMDYAKSMVKKHNKILKNNVVVGEASILPFIDNSFDKVFAYSIFQYFPDKEHASKVVKEMQRVCKGPVFVGDLVSTSHNEHHLLLNKKDFDGKVSEGLYDKSKFNVLFK